MEHEIDDESFLAGDAEAGRGELEAQVLPIPRTLEHAVASGRIDETAPSLFQAMEKAGESAELTMPSPRSLPGEIDFNTELQPGDRLC